MIIGTVNNTVDGTRYDLLGHAKQGLIFCLCVSFIIVLLQCYFGGVYVSVSLSAQNLENYWSEIDVTWYEYARWWTL